MLRASKYIALGMLTWIPGLHEKLRRGTGGTSSARYCYSVWLRHLVLNAALRPPATIRSIGELGPGDSLGIGLAALLCGAERYIALDALPHAHTERNVAIFDELVALFRERVAIPDAAEFPAANPTLDDYSFPSALLSDPFMDAALAPQRLRRIRADIARLDGAVRYFPGWHQAGTIANDSVDLIFSQAVLEHVDQLEDAYVAMYRWLNVGGVMSHQIDFKCHATADKWNGHLAYSDLTWKLMRGRLPYFINRRSATDHLRAAEAAGFRVIEVRRMLRSDGLPPYELASRFRSISLEDAQTAGAFLQAVRGPDSQVAS